jgi:hypothetical protein
MAYNYHKSQIYGSGKFDYVWVTNVTETQGFIDATTGATYVPAWTDDTVLLASFNNNINGGDITFSGESITNWLIYKKEDGNNTLTYVATVPSTQTSIIDYNVKNNTDYSYQVFAETPSFLSQPLITSESVTTSWWNWSLVGLKNTDTDNFYYVDTDNVWKFDTELSSEALVQNVDRNTFEGFTKYPKVTKSDKNYITGGITALISNPVNGVYSDTVAMKNNFRDFVNNGEIKLLRDRKGSAWLVETMSNEFQLTDKSAEQITQLTFKFTQIGDSDEISAVERG